MGPSAVRHVAPDLEVAPVTVPVMDVIAGLSRALDITEGHPQGHAARSAVIGMQCADLLELGEPDRSDLFHALLLKDAGCSSNAARVHQLFGGNDHHAKRAVWLTDWRRGRRRSATAWRSPAVAKAWRAGRVASWRWPPAAARPRPSCSRSAVTAAPPSRSTWDCRRPRPRRSGRWTSTGTAAACPAAAAATRFRCWRRSSASARSWRSSGTSTDGKPRSTSCASARGRWFSPQLVEVAEAVAHDAFFWRDLATTDAVELLHRVAPAPALVEADDARLDGIVEAFAGVIDAKSPYTHDHSRRVAGYAVAAAERLGAASRSLVRLRRAALLHDIGKLGVPNCVLDKPGKLTADEWALMRSHTQHTHQILDAVPVFRDVAFDAACHHERLDGTGYHLGLGGAALGPAARVLAVADVTDALCSDRPYRAGLDIDHVVAELMADVAANKLCAQSAGAMCDVLRGC